MIPIAIAVGVLLYFVAAVAFGTIFWEELDGDASPLALFITIAWPVGVAFYIAWRLGRRIKRTLKAPE